MVINLRWFNKSDILNKVKWINDPKINMYLHYELPLCPDRTLKWYNNIIGNSSRADFVFEIENNNNNIVPIGLIGLLDISMKNKKAEFYIVTGNQDYLGKGIATKAAKKFLEYAFKKYDLNKIYLYTEVENIKAQRLFERIGFVKEGILKDDLYQNGEFLDRCYYALFRKDFFNV